MRTFYFEVIILLQCSFIIVFCVPKKDLNKRTANLNDCIINIDGIEINIFDNKNGYEFSSGNNTYILNICGPAIKCRYPDASVCIVNEKKEIKIIGLFNTFSFKHRRLKYRYARDAETIIDFKCNRHLKIPYIIFDSLVNRNIYKFIFYTSLICAKLPMMCKLYDVENNLQYDLTSLYSLNYNRIVKNVYHGVEVYLNVCGELHLIKSKNNECRYEGTQICAVDQFGMATNWGVFSTELKLSDNGLSVNFTGGSLCRNISSIVTKLDFICSFNDSGPILLFSSDCEYNIVWYTPSACPYYSSINEDCMLHNDMYRRQTKSVYLSGYKEQQLSTNVKMKYNICGVLKDSCNGQMNVSICLINNNEEIIFGFSNFNLISRDTSVYINLIGEICGNKNMHHSVNIQFRCDYTTDKLEKISISKDLCIANITVFTSKVCRQSDILVKRCKAPANNSHNYDLTPLMLEDHNYEVIDPDDSSKVYLLNVCLPVVFGTDALCAFDCAVCLRNNTEPNMYKRFKSVGNYMKSSGLELQNDKLIIQYESGVVCPGSSRPDYKTIIEYRCINQSEISDIKLSKTDCVYTFIWKTQYACPIDKTNRVTVESGIAINKINKEDLAKFVNAGNENIHQNDEESSTSQIITIDTTQETKIEQNMKMKLQSTIQNKNISNANNTATISMYVPLEVPDSSGISLKNCTLTDKINEVNKFNMYSLPRISHILSKTGKLYLVNICQQSQIKCTSMRCLSNIHIALDKQFIIINFSDKLQSTCNDRSYNSVIIMKCSHEVETPVVSQEQECSVQIEWKNSAACAFLKPEYHSASATGKMVVISIVSLFIIICVAIGGYYYYVRKHRISDSALHLVRCEYSRVKDSTKIA